MPTYYLQRRVDKISTQKVFSALPKSKARSRSVSGCSGDFELKKIQHRLVLCGNARPDPGGIVLLDVRMPDCTGIEVLELLSERGFLPPTILLTTFDDDMALLEGIRGGARGFLLKDISLECLAEGIRQVHSGLSLIRPAMTERVAQRIRESAPTFEKLDMPDRLTNREAEILRLMAGGFSNREIADLLGSSEGTVKNHISNILSKFGVRDRVRAVLRGIELGYV